MSPKYVIGIDEVGRGPLAGPVTVCAVMVLKKDYAWLKRQCPKLRDSKKLSAEMRETWLVKINRLRDLGKISYVHTSVNNSIIDKKGIAVAIKIAITKSLEKFHIDPVECMVLLDGSLRAPIHYKNQKTIIKGDEKECVISLASIIAKVHRDGHMKKMAKKHPGFGFEVHKGYGTAVHRAAILEKGISGIHRHTFLKNLAFPGKS